MNPWMITDTERIYLRDLVKNRWNALSHRSSSKRKTFATGIEMIGDRVVPSRYRITWQEGCVPFCLEVSARHSVTRSYSFE